MSENNTNVVIESNDINLVENLPDGMKVLVEGYIDYATETIINRALPDARDGLKPVNRRILVTLHEDRKKGIMKCQRVAGNVLKYHPHGDSAVYQAMVRMTDENETLNIPLIHGEGSFGKVYNNDKPAAPRYTECKLHPNADEYFRDLAGVDFVSNFDGTEREPVVLPITYPAVLCNPVSGVAVGFKCEIPSFNFNDVIDLTLEYLENGECKTLICPDFTTGGFYIRNEKELYKIMVTGQGKIKLRGKVEIVDKEIAITEVPYGQTLQSIKKAVNASIKKGDIQGIRSVSDYDDYEHGANLTIACTSKNRVENVLLSLYRLRTGVQNTINVDITTIIDGVPVRGGVWSQVEYWVKWRRKVLTKQYAETIEEIKENLVKPHALLKLIENSEARDTLIDLVAHKTDKDAINFLLKTFEGDELFTVDTCKWIVNRRVRELRDGDKYKKKFDELSESLRIYEGYLENIDTAIAKQLRELKATYGHEHPRRTVITTKDYNFVTNEVEEHELAKDTNTCTFVLDKARGFIKKMRYFNPENASDTIVAIDGIACDTLIGIDNKGRIIRIYGEHLPYSEVSDVGTYVPRYLNIEEEDFRVMWMGLLDGETKMLTYKNGTVGFLDTSEWVGNNRQLKVIERGVSPESWDLAHVGNVPDYLYVIDSKQRIGFAVTHDIKRKSRTARTRVFKLKDAEIAYVAGLDLIEGSSFLGNSDRYRDAVNLLESEEDLRGDLSVFVKAYA